MRGQTLLVLFIFASLALAEGVRRAQSPVLSAPYGEELKDAPSDSSPAATLNPSQSAAPVNPSQTIPPINPSQPAFPRQGLPPVNPPAPGLPNAVPTPGVNPNPDLVRPNGQMTVNIFTAITEGPNAASGATSLGTPGVAVEGLRVETNSGRILLRGTVRSEQEKADAGARAEAIAGQGKVDNRLVVRP